MFGEWCSRFAVGLPGGGHHFNVYGGRFFRLVTASYRFTIYKASLVSELKFALILKFCTNTNTISELKFALIPGLLFSPACFPFFLFFLFVGDFLQTSSVVRSLGTVDVNHVVVALPLHDLEGSGVGSHEFVLC